MLDSIKLNFGDIATTNFIWLTLTNYCNVHCSYCFNYVHKDHELMAPSTAVGILSQHLKSLDTEKINKLYINYFGGEPTANFPSLRAAHDFLIEHDIECKQNLLTNGFIKASTLEWLLTTNIQYQISFDGLENSLRFYKKSSNDFSQHTIDTIKTLIDHGKDVKLRCTIHQDNVDNIISLIEFANNYNIKNIAFAPICNFGDAKSNKIKQPDLNKFVTNLRYAYDLAFDNGIVVDTETEELFRQQRWINAPFIWLPDGKAAMTITYASSKLPNAESIIIGEYQEERQEILVDKPKIQQMTDNYYNNVERYCKDCSIRELCGGRIHFTPFATDTFNEARDRYFCDLEIKTLNSFELKI